jgi:hypothetical protein
MGTKLEKERKNPFINRIFNEIDSSIFVVFTLDDKTDSGAWWILNVTSIDNMLHFPIRSSSFLPFILPDRKSRYDYQFLLLFPSI